MLKSKPSPEITIGCVVTDLATGFEGVVTSSNEMFNGNIQYAVQPKATKGSEKLPDSFAFDAIGLRFKDKGISDSAVAPQFTDIRVGDEVEDIITGHKGIAVTKATFLNGCIYFDVVKKANEAEKIESTSMFLSASRLKKTLAEPVKPVTAVKGERPTGGPTTRALRAN